MSFGRKMRRNIERARFGRPFPGKPSGNERTRKGGIVAHAKAANSPTFERRPARAFEPPARRGVNRGCNVGGSGLKPMRFADGRLRNRAQPKVYKRQADGTYA
jgi:hypothetical protein